MQQREEVTALNAAHGEILAAFPGAWLFVALHLSEYPSGRPMHAAANARYHAEHTGPHLAAQYLRVDDVRDLPRTLEPEAWEAFCAAQAERWRAEARAAVETLRMMPTLYDLRGYDVHGDACVHDGVRGPVPLPAWLIGADPETVNV